MKPLLQLDNIGRARILFQLFPDMIRDFIAFQKQVSEKIVADPDNIYRVWEDRYFLPEFWIEQANEILERHKKIKGKLAKNSKWFSDQLFTGCCGLYSERCLKLFIKELNENHVFTHGVKMLFTN